MRGRDAQRAATVAILLCVMSCSDGCSPATLGGADSAMSSALNVKRSARLSLDYQIEVEAQAGQPARLVTRLCMEGAIPKALIPGIPRAGRYLIDARRDSDGARLPIRKSDGRVSTEGLPNGACLRLTVGLQQLAQHEQGGALTLVSAGALTTSAGLWLWRPDLLPAGMRARVRFRVAPGMSVSAPWPRVAEGAFILRSEAFQLPSRIVLGAFDALSLAERPGWPRVHVAVLKGERAASDAGILRWIEAALIAQGHVFEGPGVEALQVVVVPVPGGASEPVGFGMALRGGGAAVLLFLGAAATDEALPGEWVSVHELFHTGMPRLEASAAWLFEGVTQYYTELLRARAGFATEREAWQRLVSGFGRGQRGGTGRTLAEESRDMQRTGAYQRVYWGGAALALRWDVALRRASKGSRSLDDAMEALRRCCAGEPVSWSAERLLAWLDAWWGGAPLFKPLSQQALSSRAFPETAGLLNALGVRVEGGRVRLIEASESRTRQALVAPKER